MVGGGAPSSSGKAADIFICQSFGSDAKLTASECVFNANSMVKSTRSGAICRAAVLSGVPEGRPVQYCSVWSTPPQERASASLSSLSSFDIRSAGMEE